MPEKNKNMKQEQEHVDEKEFVNTFLSMSEAERGGKVTTYIGEAGRSNIS